MVTMYYRGSSGAVIVYDITNQLSFDHVKNWVSDLRQAVPDVAIALIGNKYDIESDRVIKRDDMIALAKELRINVYAEVSAKTGENVHEVFWTLARAMKPVERNETNVIEHHQLDEQQQDNSSCC